MTSLFGRLMSNGLADLAGLQISGTLPVKQDLLNEMLGEVMQSMAAPKSAAPKQPGAVDPAQFLKLVKRAYVRADAGILILDFEIRA